MTIGDRVPFLKGTEMDAEEKRDETYAYIAAIYAETGVPSTVRQVATKFGLSINGAMRRIETLIKHGRVKRVFAEEGARAHFIPFVPIGYCPCCALPRNRRS